MARLFHVKRKQAASAPGTVEYAGEKKVDKVTISVIDYDEGQIDERQVETVTDCLPYHDKPSVTWINIDGLHETDSILELGQHFGIHSLVLEDIVNTSQRPKLTAAASRPVRRSKSAAPRQAVASTSAVPSATSTRSSGPSASTRTDCLPSGAVAINASGSAKCDSTQAWAGGRSARELRP